MLKKIFIICLLFIALLFVASAGQAQNIGQDSGGILDTVAGNVFNTDLGDDPDIFLNTTAGGIIALALGFVGILFLGMTIYSGIQWMTAGGNEEQVTKARKKIINAAVGLGMVILAYVISNTVFALFYDVSERQNAGQTGEGLPCTTSNECPGSLVCVNNVCTQLCTTDDDCPGGMVCDLWSGQCTTGWGSNCEGNSDCPINAPICVTWGIWKMCTCTETGPLPHDQCPPSLPYCVDAGTFELGYSGDPAVCVECISNNNCQNQPYGLCYHGDCHAVECLEDSNCSAPTPYCLSASLFANPNPPNYTCVECYGNWHCPGNQICELTNYTCQ